MTDNTPNMREDNQDKDQKHEQKESTSGKSNKQEVQKEQEPKKEELMQKCNEYLNGWKRAQADYQNLKKEMEERQQQLGQFVTSSVIQDFLPLVDYFKYAFAHEIPENFKNAEWMKGIQHIQNFLHQILAKHNIQEIKTIGEKFDPHLHEAIAQVESDKQSGTIAEEVSTGFTQNGKVIKHAKVKVVK